MSEQQTPVVVQEAEKKGNGFEPGKYLTKLSRRSRTADGGWKTVEQEYMEVKWRLLWLRTEQPEAEVATELVQLDLDRNLAVFKASVRLSGGGNATGWGSETADDWRDFIEKAETKALGRALAALGYGTQFCEDFDFSQGREEKVVDAPVNIRATRDAGGPRPVRGQPAEAPTGPAAVQNGGWTDRPATEAQIKAIYAIARGAQAMDDAMLEEWTRNRHGCLPAELTRRQASEMIDALRLGTAS